MRLKKVIKELAEGKIVIENDLPDTKLLAKILKKAFPKDNGVNDWSDNKYFEKSKLHPESFNTGFDNDYNLSLPIVKLSTIQTKSKNDVIEFLSDCQITLDKKQTQLEESFSKLAKDVAEIKEQLTPKECPRNIECDFENVKPVLEAGKWYIDKYKRLFCPVEIVNDIRCMAYGFGTSGSFIKNDYLPWEINGSERLSTPQEVQQALEAEARKRGFKSGVKINNKSITGYEENWIISGEESYKYNQNYNTLDYLYDCTIFKDGVWATIISEPEESLLDKAKRLYPVGTEFISTYLKDRRTVKGDLWKESSMYVSFDGSTVYDKEDNLWAEIIEQPKEEVIDWDKPQTVVSKNGLNIIFNTGSHTNTYFDGYKIKDGVFDKCEAYYKDHFQPYKEPITINQK